MIFQRFMKRIQSLLGQTTNQSHFQEMIDLKRSILALKQYELRQQDKVIGVGRRPAGPGGPPPLSSTVPSSSSSSPASTSITSSTTDSISIDSNNSHHKESIHDDEYYLNLAIEQLEQQNADDLIKSELYTMLQSLLQPQITTIFEQFRTTEIILGLDGSSGNTHSTTTTSNTTIGHTTSAAQLVTEGNSMINVSSSKRTTNAATTKQAVVPKPAFVKRLKGICEPYLTKELVETQQYLIQETNHDDDDEKKDTTLSSSQNLKEPTQTQTQQEQQHLMFHIRKHHVLDSILTKLEGSSNSDGSQQHLPQLTQEEIMIMIQMCKNSILKHSYTGYGVMVLPSTIPNAGYGLFLDGYASIGSIVAFLPGITWPREYLMDPKKMSDEYKFHDDPNYELTLRPDGALVDSRHVSHLLSIKEGTNLFNLGHVINHPTNIPTTTTNSGDFQEQLVLTPNVVGVPFDFYKPKTIYPHYIPNRWARKPHLLGTLALNTDLLMQSQLFIATRDLQNEELFLNYRLNPNHSDNFPSWYIPCGDQEETQNMWSTTTSKQ